MWLAVLGFRGSGLGFRVLDFWNLGLVHRLE